MKALTVKAPWGTAIAKLGKDIENRSWPPPASVIGQRIAIHEGAGLMRDGLAELEPGTAAVRFTASSFRLAGMAYGDRIVRDPAVCAGQPIIRGTRVLVRTILGYLAHGESVETIVQEFPSLTPEDVRAVIAFAAAAAGEDLPAPAPLPPDIKVA